MSLHAARNQELQALSVRSEAAMPNDSPRPVPNFLLSAPQDFPETAGNSSTGKFGCLSLPKISPSPSLRRKPEIIVVPNIGDDSQRSSISSASGQSVATHCTTATTATVTDKLMTTSMNVANDAIDMDDDDDGLILKPLLLVAAEGSVEISLQRSHPGN